MFLVQIAAFVGVGAFAWIVFQYVGVVYSKQKKLSLPAVLAETLIFFVHGISGFFFLNWSGPDAVGSDWSVGLGAILVAVGLVATVTGMRHLGWRATFGQGTAWESTGARPVANTGLYMYSRNPQLISYAIFLVGCVLLWPAWAAIAWLLLYVFIAVIMVRTEEKHLIEEHPDAFDHYRNEVPRWFGVRHESNYFD